jgi:hypothetical protein
MLFLGGEVPAQRYRLPALVALYDCRLCVILCDVLASVRSEVFGAILWSYCVRVVQAGLQWYFRIEIPTGAFKFSASMLPHISYVHTDTLKRRNRVLHLPLPHWLSDILEWFWLKVRPFLNATPSNVAQYFEDSNLQITEHNRICPQNPVQPLHSQQQLL